MRALILAAGYGTRLRPLTDTWAKELLPVGGRPMVDWILDGIEAIPGLEEVHLVTNAPKAAAFAEWARGRSVRIHDDGTTSNDDRLGAIGDLRFVVEQAEIDDDLLVIAGDNLCEFSLPDFAAFWRSKGVASAVALRDVGSLELVRRYGVVALDSSSRIVAFEEKPEAPESTLAATATYLYHREHLALLDTYLAEGNSPDQPGRFPAWLHTRAPVYGWTFDAPWYDVGDLEQLLVADNHVRVRLGLPLRDAYTPE